MWFRFRIRIKDETAESKLAPDGPWTCGGTPNFTEPSRLAGCTQGRQKAVPACSAGPLGQVAEAGAGGQKEAHLFGRQGALSSIFHLLWNSQRL